MLDCEANDTPDIPVTRPILQNTTHVLQRICLQEISGGGGSRAEVSEGAGVKTAMERVYVQSHLPRQVWCGGRPGANGTTGTPFVGDGDPALTHILAFSLNFISQLSENPQNNHNYVLHSSQITFFCLKKGIY